MLRLFSLQLLLLYDLVKPDEWNISFDIIIQRLPP